MAVVLEFPRVRERFHALASSSIEAGIDLSRAANVVIRRDVNPASSAVLVDNTVDHHSHGMLDRCHHLDTVEAPTLTPAKRVISSASFSRVGHNSITARNDLMSGGMTNLLGPAVLEIKSNLSRDSGGDVDDYTAMKKQAEKLANLEFVARVRAARLARFDSQRPMLTLLGLDQGTYKQYETRTPLPHRFIPKFIAATGVSYEWLLTGEGKGPVINDIPKRKVRHTGRSKDRVA